MSRCRIFIVCYICVGVENCHANVSISIVCSFVSTAENIVTCWRSRESASTIPNVYMINFCYPAGNVPSVWNNRKSIDGIGTILGSGRYHTRYVKSELGKKIVAPC